MITPTSGTAVNTPTATPRLSGAGRSTSQQNKPNTTPLTTPWAIVTRM